MKRMEILKRLEKAGVIAVVRGKDHTEAVQASEAILAGGIKGIEVTFTVPNAQAVIQELAETYRGREEEAVIGAGTVLDAMTARLAIMAGAEFIVSPSFDQETAEICNLYQIPYLPGCMTITEIQQALKSGADIIKLFPGSVSGLSMVSAVKAPLPHVNLMPTGGVNLENMATWFEAGVVAVGVGGNLLAPAAKGDFEQVTEIAQHYAAKLAEIRGKANG